MSAVPFDTHALVKRLQSAGFTVEQAEAIADAQMESGAAFVDQVKHDYHLDELATKRDLKELEIRMEAIRSDLRRDIAETKADLTRWVVGMGVLQSTLLIGALMKMAHLI